MAMSCSSQENEDYQMSGKSQKPGFHDEPLILQNMFLFSKPFKINP